MTNKSLLILLINIFIFTNAYPSGTNDSDSCRVKEIYMDGRLSGFLELPDLSFYFQYPANGKYIIYMIAKDSSGKIVLENTYLYNLKGQLIKEFNNNNDTFVYEYDSKGNIKKTFFLDDGMPSLIEIYSYNISNQIIKIAKRNSNTDSIHEYSVFSYDRRGNIKRILRFEDDEYCLLDSSILTYDSLKSNKVIHKAYTVFDGDLKENGPDNLVEIKLYSSGKLSTTESKFYEFNSKGYIIKESDFRDGKFVGVIKCLYDCY